MRTLSLRRFAVVVAVLAVSVPASAGWEEGKAALNRGDLETALAEFTAAVERTPDYGWAHYMLGLTLERMRQTDAAIARFRRAAELDPGERTFAVGLATTLLAADEYGEAATVLGGIDGSDAQLERLRAAAALGRGDAPAALAAAERALAAAPDDPAALGLLARALERGGRLREAFDAYRRAWRLAPDDSDVGADAVRVGLAAARELDDESRRSLYGEVAAVAVPVAEADPRHPTALSAGEALLGAKRFDDAARWFENARLTAPEDPVTLYYCGLVLRCRERGGEARRHLEAALEHGADAALRPRIHGELARIAESELDLEEAVRHLQLAGQTGRAAELEALRRGFRDAIAAREELQTTVDDLRSTLSDLEAIDEIDAARQVAHRIEEFEVELARADANLDEVRAALAEGRSSCR